MKKSVLIDTDPGVDDALAILLAMRSPELHIEAITTVCGNVQVEQATINVFRILELAGIEEYPVIGQGSCDPLQKTLTTATHIHGDDGLGGIEPAGEPPGRFCRVDSEGNFDLPSAEDVMLDFAKRADGTIVCLGPLTNLARAVQKDERLLKNVREIVIMGGAIEAPGNITPVAEFNIYSDPHAADVVFRSGLPVTLVPLDVTGVTALKLSDLEAVKETDLDPVGRFVFERSVHMIGLMDTLGREAAFALHDPLAVGAAVDGTLLTCRPVPLCVETEGLVTEGMTVADRRPLRDEFKPYPRVRVAFDADSQRFVEMFKERLL